MVSAGSHDLTLRGQTASLSREDEPRCHHLGSVPVSKPLGVLRQAQGACRALCLSGSEGRDLGRPSLPDFPRLLLPDLLPAHRTKASPEAYVYSRSRSFIPFIPSISIY